MAKSLVALDTNHIKQYVFATGKLKEIRGASSLLDRLNRQVMNEEARRLTSEFCAIYTNGGSGLFLIDSQHAETFGKNVQHAYSTQTAGGASLTYVVQSLPKDAPEAIEEILDCDLLPTLTLLRYRLREEKGCPPTLLALPSHPLMHTCDSCGVFYAEGKDQSRGRDPGERDALYCQSCMNKRTEDVGVKEYIDDVLHDAEAPRSSDEKCMVVALESKSPLWDNVIRLLRRRNYKMTYGMHRPKDFNVFREFSKSKEYMGLIYADANGMGQKMEQLPTLREVARFAKEIDEAIYRVVSDAITRYLRTEQHSKQSDGTDDELFPFDILLLGGDDLVIVTPASVALQVAHVIAKAFYQPAKAENKQVERSLSVGVVLAPVNYPFGLLQVLADETLKFAKKDSAKNRAAKQSQYGATRVNFLVVTGSTSQSFDKVYTSLSKVYEKENRAFYATMRPYTIEQLTFLLEKLQVGNELALGRTKLHQLREAVLQKNLTTSVVDALAVLRNWNEKQRTFVVRQVYTQDGQYALHQWDEEKGAANFPRISFPWFMAHKKGDVEVYQTLLLDFVELYDFVAREGEGESSEEV